ncbi:hypothetical protein [Microtetraspora malaysiensis]|uniref:hypothetical protein n=1 Tax=Microtetraspora malaysiensis TaxID=161358 RepID=UPI0009FC260B|nr:hypothetical protein [Microtetraspora malaysiensis]
MTHPMLDDRRPAVRRSAPLPRIVRALVRRWPTWLGIACAFLFHVDDGRAAGVFVFVAALAYLTTAVLDRPRSAWLTVLGLTVVAVVSQVLGVGYAVVLGPAALVIAVIGLVRGQLRRPGLCALQAPAMLVFGAVVLAAVHAGWALGSAVMAAALIAHGIWDIFHLRANRIVSRSMAEWCAILDLLLGVGILVLL